MAIKGKVSPVSKVQIGGDSSPRSVAKQVTHRVMSDIRNRYKPGAGGTKTSKSSKSIGSVGTAAKKLTALSKLVKR